MRVQEDCRRLFLAKLLTPDKVESELKILLVIVIVIEINTHVISSKMIDVI